MGKEKHILVFCPLYPPIMGGLPNHAEQFNAALAARGYAISVFTPQLARSAAAYEQRGHVKIIRFPAWQVITNYPLPRIWSPRFWRMWRELTKNEYTVIISRTRFFFTTPLAYYFSRRHHLRWMHIEHGSGPVYLPHVLLGFIARSVDWLFSKLAFRRADILVAVSRAGGEFIRRIAPGRPMEVIYRGIEVTHLQAIAADTSIRAGHDYKVLVGYVGRLVYGKGIQDLLEALASVAHLPFVCCLIGDGSERTYFESLAARLGLHGKVLFLGDLPWSKTIAFMKAVDIVVNPSYTEGLPTSIVEAAFCQKAIVAADVGGTREIITGHGDGVLFPPHDRMALATALAYLIEDEPARRAMGKAAYENIRSRFSWDDAAICYSRLL
ncbi:MAG: glycosyltransferase family 4 protein [Candidatus Andersenbacteria bacterium]|nr:glycosyltransferase family 4 protein [Candidatus Andersenbacteria bacterium]